MIWLPGVARDESIMGAGGGSYAADGSAWRIVLHTTEGGWEGSMGVFRSRLTAPHLMVDPASRKRVQMIPLDRSAYALRNEAGGGETNRAHCLQVEIVGYASEAAGWSGDRLDWLGREVIAPLVEHAPGPIALRAPRFYGEGAGWVLATPSARQRMSQEQWRTFSGVCGHQHVPENSHWDPGEVRIERILTAAQPGLDLGGVTVPGSMTPEQVVKLVQQNRKLTQSSVAAAERRLRDRIDALAAASDGATADEVAALLAARDSELQAKLVKAVRGAVAKAVSDLPAGVDGSQLAEAVGDRISDELASILQAAADAAAG